MANHYFDAQPQTPDKQSTVTARIWSNDLEFTTAAGVFARGGLDKATRVLLEASSPPRDTATVILDLGCGWGPIACAVAAVNPSATVYAIDTNERALELTRLNARKAGLADRIIACVPESVPADITFDAIWSNPPIRVGKTALHELLARWLPRLHRGAKARLVVGKNLGADSLQSWLIEQGWPTVRETSAKGFRVLVVTAP